MLVRPVSGWAVTIDGKVVILCDEAEAWRLGAGIPECDIAEVRFASPAR